MSLSDEHKTFNSLKLSGADKNVAIAVLTMMHHMPEGAVVFSRLRMELGITYGPPLTALFKGICGGKPRVAAALAHTALNNLVDMSIERVRAAVDAVMAGEPHNIDLECVSKAAPF